MAFPNSESSRQNPKRKTTNSKVHHDNDWITVAVLVFLISPSVIHAKGDDFKSVVKMIEQFYGVKHKGIPFLAQARMKVARTAARIKGGPAKRIAEAGSIQLAIFEDCDATEEILIRDNVIFNSLTVELRTMFKFLLPVGKPIAGWAGLSLYGSAKHLAQRSGGEAVKVGRVKDYAAGLSRIIGNLTARYGLGFTLAENETDDGRMHRLEVRSRRRTRREKNANSR